MKKIMQKQKSELKNTKNKILEKIIKYLKNANPTIQKLKKIPMNINLLEKGYLDSFGIIELVEFIQDKWKIEIKDDDLTHKNMGSLNKVIDMIVKKTK